MRKWITLLFTPSAWDIISWLQVAFPFLAGGGTGMIGGLHDQLPLMWVVVGTALVFASTTLGMAGYRGQMFQRDPRHKLKFVTPCVMRGIEDDIRIGFEVRNDAVFLIEVNIGHMRTSCSGRINQQSTQTGPKFQIAPGETKYYHHPPILIAGIGDEVMLGRIELSLSYGHPGRLKCDIQKDLDIFIPRDSTRLFQSADHPPVG